MNTDDLYNISKLIIIWKYKIQDFHEFKIPKVTVRDILVKLFNVNVVKLHPN
ncbi:MAG: hypothetical protein ACR5KW_00210 [Wolbachia sp.]